MIHFNKQGTDSASRKVIWVSTSLSTHGGIATFVRNMKATEFWMRWDIKHVATHCNGSRVARIRIFLRALTTFAFTLAKRPRLVHIHMSSSGSFARKAILSWMCFSTRTPVVVHIHGSRFHEFFEAVPVPVKYVVRVTLERADTVVALGEAWATRLSAIAPQARIRVIPNAIKPSAPVQQRADGPVHVTFLGEVCARKGTFLLIEAWSAMLQQHPNIEARLTVAGNGDVDKAIDLVRHLSVGESVDVTGWIAPNDVGRVLSTTHILVLPSVNEGQPMAILEAMARGICVVASTSGGIPEMLGDSSGILIDPLGVDELSHGLATVIIDGELRRRIGANALDRVRERFDVDQICSQFDKLYMEILQGPQ